MRILVFGISSQFGGVESFLKNFCTSLINSEQNYNFEFIVFDEIPEHCSCYLNEGCKFHTVPNRIKNWPGYINGLKNIVANGDYDCLWYNACTLSDITLLKLATPKIPIRILHSHAAGAVGNGINNILHKFHKLSVSNYVTHYLTCSENAAEFMFPQAVLRQDNFMLIKNGIDTNAYIRNAELRKTARANLGLNTEPTFINVGRLSKEKNHAFLIGVFNEIVKKLPNAKLLLVGEGPEREKISSLIKDFSLQNNVTLLGARAEVPEILKAADVFLLPSVREGFSLVLLEAQTSGLECLASDGVPTTSFLAENAIRIPLDEQTWVVNSLDAFRRSQLSFDDNISLIREKGFDINDSSKALDAFFSKAYQEVITIK